MAVDGFDDDFGEVDELESIHPLVRSSLPRGDSLAALSAWSVLEALSPRTYATEKDLMEGGGHLVEVSENILAWDEPAEPRADHNAYFRVGLGSIDMRTATKGILDAFGWDEGTVRPQSSNALLGMVLLDGRGAPLASGTSISSFGWALPMVLGGNLTGMTRWGEVESDAITALNEMLCVPDPELAGKLKPLTWAAIVKAHEFLLDRFKIPGHLVDGPGTAFGFEQRIRPGVVPQPYLLNSFLLASIERAHGLVAAEEPPKALGAYMGFYEAERPVDVLADREGLSRLLSPMATPAGRWPTPGGHTLATLQQAAVNAALIDEPGTPGLQSVNGPPGTGKTTMIRDVAAGNLIARAARMVEADDPEDMFPAVKLRNGRTVHSVDPSLRGFEMIVASSNNKAVENVSRELPLLGAVDPGAGVPRYFRTTSDYLAGVSLDPRARPAPPDAGTWGLISATLGNSGNRSAFMERFWWNEDHGMRTWLRIAKGEPVRIEVKDAKGKKTGERPPLMLKAERIPKGRPEALKLWGEVRARFREALEDVRKDLNGLAAYETAAMQVPHLEAAVAQARLALDAGGRAPAASPLRGRLDKARDNLADAVAELARAEAARPKFHHATGRDEEYHLWEAEVAEAKGRVELYTSTCARLGPAVAAESATGTPTSLEAHAVLDKAERDLADARRRIGTFAPRVGQPVDAAFFEAGHEAWNLASPWMDKALQEKRARLFGLAMEVHEAFALAAARPMLRNLAAYSEATGNNGSSELASRIPDLWSTLFLVVPVVSTTFASAGRMLDGLPPGSLGWLIVDEAGQATPQAAVGALVACKRALFVGDPLQIEPVSTLPARLVNRICDHFRVEPSSWVAPTASAQSLSDRASPLRATFPTGHDERAVGMPLLVHRRCQEPMFGISNRIAYAGLMVHAAAGGSGRASRQSTWFDVNGPHEGKYCPAEGDFAADILKRMAMGGRDPDVFFISPFREVAANLRKRLAAEADNFATDGTAWARDRVGTVHTFQGREATSVVLVLGAGEANHAGARKWAGRTPNIANVAVTRAKDRLYVIGSLDAWGSAGAFEAVAEALPNVRIARTPAPVRKSDPEPFEATGLRALGRMR